MYAGRVLCTPEINVYLCRERFIHASNKCLCIWRGLYTLAINVYVCQEKFIHASDKCLCVPGEVYTH